MQHLLCPHNDQLGQGMEWIGNGMSEVIHQIMEKILSDMVKLQGVVWYESPV